MELFDTSQFSSKNDAARDFELENVSPKKKAGMRSPHKSDPAWDNGSAFPSSKNWKVGDRVTTSHPLQKGKVYTIGAYPSIDATGKACYDWIETTCNLLLKCDSLTFVQELEPDSATQACNSDLSLSELQKQTSTVAISSASDIQESTITETCDRLPLKEDLDCEAEKSTLLQPLPPVPPSQEKDSDSVQATTATASPRFYESSTNISQNSQLLKTLPVSSIAQLPQETQPAHISEVYSEPLTKAGTMRNGSLWELDMLEVPLLENEYCWLPSPGALSSTGKGRPPGQTKQEGELKKLDLLQKNEVLNPAILCQWYEIPQTWLDPSESRVATELLENNERQQEICLIPELPVSPSVESCTCNQLQSSPIPENFLEESTADTKQLPSRKRRQRKGCLYKYLENKKLKNGNIASYPRVIGETRDPDNPKHWRWGFNWEEKIDGEWKGRSIGSVPIGAIALIQSMQKSNTSLEEIIGFIRRTKAKPQKP